jgi:hypothetical protein
MPAVLSKSEKRRIKALLDEVKIEEFKSIPEYWNEVRECALRDYRRAAYVLLWGALIESLYLRIDRVGIEIFAKANKNKLNKAINSIDHLYELQDNELIKGLWAADMISAEQLDRLQHFRNLRNKYAHPTDYSVRAYDVISLLEFAIEDFWSQMPGGYLPVSFFTSVVFNPEYELKHGRLETILLWLNQKDFLQLADSLIAEYCHEDEDSSLIQPRIKLAWTWLATKLDIHQKRQVNTKVAKRAIRVNKPANIGLYQFIFWDEIASTEQQHRNDLWTHVIRYECVRPDEYVQLDETGRFPSGLRESDIDYNAIVTRVASAQPQSIEQCRLLVEEIYDELLKGGSQ